jgi:uncharacterized membrane protein YbhN (UPF0104 family)
MAVVALIASPAILYYILSRAGLPVTLVSGVVILMAAKHLGLLAVVLGPLYALFRRRPRQSKPEDPASATRNPDRSS